VYNDIYDVKLILFEDDKQVLKESYVDAIVNAFVYIKRKAVQKDTNDPIKILSYVLLAIAFLAKNQPDILRTTYSVAGGIAAGYLIAQSATPEGDMEEGDVNRLHLTIVAIISLIAVSFIPNIIAKLLSPDNTTDVKTRIKRKAMKFAVTFNTCLIVSLIIFSKYLKSDFSIIKNKVGLIFIQSAAVFIIYNILAIKNELTEIKYDSENLKQIITKLVKKVTKKLIQQVTEMDETAPEVQTVNKIKITYLDNDELSKKKSLQEVDQVVKTYFSMNPILCFAVIGDTMYVSNKLKTQEMLPLAELMPQFLSCMQTVINNAKQKLDVNYNDYVKTTTFYCIPTESEKNSGKILNAFHTRKHISYLIYYNTKTHKTDITRKNLQDNLVLFPTIISHELGHSLLKNSYWAFQNSPLLSKIMLLNTRASAALFAVAMNVLGIMSSYHTELEADAVALEIMGYDTASKAFSMLSKMSSGYFNDPHNRWALRLQGFTNYYKKYVKGREKNDR
jgi:hypothetical protein